MTDLDRINELSRQVAGIREKYKPYNAADPNLRLFNSLSVAGDQLDYAAHLITMRTPDPRQMNLLNPDNSVETVDVIITPAVDWCDSCSNPKNGCTCP